MFGHDDKQQPVQDSTSVLQAAMPGPLTEPSPPVPSPVSSTFGAPAGSTTPTVPEPAADTTSPVLSAAPVDDIDVSAPSSSRNDELLELKQQALQHLSPLVSHLDQTPEEKFRTTMMMIQASDDQTLVKTAFEAAQSIPDDKARAQALLDIINEINYFTQHQGSQQASDLAL